jgi:hypothetical protein
MDKTVEALDKVFPKIGSEYFRCCLYISAVLMVAGLGAIFLNRISLAIALVILSLSLSGMVLLFSFVAMATLRICAKIEKWANKETQDKERPKPIQDSEK